MSITDLIGFGAFTTTDTGYIKSIQQVAITIGTGSTSNTETISPVDMARTAIFWNGLVTDNTGSTIREVISRIELTNATTVTAYRNTSSASFFVTVRATIVEFTSSIVDSVQAGTIAMSSAQTTNTATISSVDTSRSIALYLGSISATSGLNVSVSIAALDLTNATTVTATRGNTGSSSFTAGFMVIQFQPGIVQSLQVRAVTLSTTNTNNNDTISSVTTANTLLIYNGLYTTGSSWINGYYRCSLTNSTTVNLARGGTSGTSRTICYTVLEFVPGILNSMQRSTTDISGTSADATITSVNAAKSICNWCGLSTANSSNLFDNVFATARLLDATTVRNEKNSSATSSTVSWEIAEFI